VGIKFTEESYGGVALLGTRLPATGAGLCTVRVAAPLVIEPATLDTVTVKTVPLSVKAVVGVV
jgi:hypothetical protein